MIASRVDDESPATHTAHMARDDVNTKGAAAEAAARKRAWADELGRERDRWERLTEAERDAERGLLKRSGVWPVSEPPPAP